MNPIAQLATRESTIAELFAWGASKKDIANQLHISRHTVENHARNIYEKTQCAKVNELSAWWFCSRYDIPFELSPLKIKAMDKIIFDMNIPADLLKSGRKDVYVRVKTERVFNRIVSSFVAMNINLLSEIKDDCKDALCKCASDCSEKQWQARNNAIAIGNLKVMDDGKIIKSALKK